MNALNSAATEIKLIHIAKSSLQMGDDTYRDLVARFSDGKASSSKDLSASQRRALLNHMKACGFQLRTRSGTTGSEWHREPQMRKLRAMWYAMAEGGHVERPTDAKACDAAIETWAMRQLAPQGRIDSLRWASGAQMNKLIEELKAWGKRVGAAIVAN